MALCRALQEQAALRSASRCRCGSTQSVKTCAWLSRKDNKLSVIARAVSVSKREVTSSGAAGEDEEQEISRADVGPL